MNRLIRSLLGGLILLFCFAVHASPVAKITMKGAFEDHYDWVSQSLEEHRFYVILEPNIGRSLSNFKERWGEDYNRNGYEEIRSLVFCNPWYVNQVVNKDPEMAALCPLSVTLLHKGGTTDVLLLRPSQLKPNSPAQAILEELETDIMKALNAAQKP
ncbi:DUF302 domain-containing protein [Neptuniibacter caesariensis]|uniref:DUF302 domain-containing protein n=1 Tax=Neptuniibacter caesariensis TaxID=207954 RepID=A0A7U8GSC7_NEPCE|nr:DUF302 domain-containing protein [Neptuniibacter caesariensis]EAR60940.1 hypothetical protein MED92_02036 [Oceanospirillum sp. MED92] [Neptuniibacter caesariensis]